MLFKAIFKLIYTFKLCLLSYINYCKLSLIWTIGKGFKTEGTVYVPAVRGEVTLGDNVWLGNDVRIGATKNAKLSIGNNVSINQGTFVICRESITIGNDCRIGEYVSIRDNDHKWNNPNQVISKQGFTVSAVSIGNDVWIGRGAAIMKGVHIGNGAIIGANAVVTKNVESYLVVAGIPAKVIAKRKGNE